MITANANGKPTYYSHTFVPQSIVQGNSCVYRHSHWIKFQYINSTLPKNRLNIFIVIVTDDWLTWWTVIRLFFFRRLPRISMGFVLLVLFTFSLHSSGTYKPNGKRREIQAVIKRTRVVRARDFLSTQRSRQMYSLLDSNSLRNTRKRSIDFLNMRRTGYVR